MAGRERLKGISADKRQLKGGREKMSRDTFVSDMSTYLLSFAGQWGPAVYLCYKVGLAKANTLVYEAGKWPLFLSTP